MRDKFLKQSVGFCGSQDSQVKAQVVTTRDTTIAHSARDTAMQNIINSPAYRARN